MPRSSHRTATARRWREPLERFLRGEPGISFAVLFGSQARGQARRDSDLDIALGTARRAHALDTKLLRLAAQLSLAAGREVHLVPLCDTALALRFAVARDGVLLWERRRGEFGRFRVRTSIERADIEALVARLRRSYLERVAAEAHG